MGIRPIMGQELHKEIDMGKAADRQKYIHNLAGTIMAGSYVYPKDAKELLQWYGTNVSNKLARFSDQTLGKIAACGFSRDASTILVENNTTLFDVRGGDHLGWEKEGRDLLLEIAVTAVIAAMMDIARAKKKKG